MDKNLNILDVQHVDSALREDVRRQYMGRHEQEEDGGSVRAV